MVLFSPMEHAGNVSALLYDHPFFPKEILFSLETILKEKAPLLQRGCRGVPFSQFMVPDVWFEQTTFSV